MTIEDSICKVQGRALDDYESLDCGFANYRMKRKGRFYCGFISSTSEFNFVVIIDETNSSRPYLKTVRPLGECIKFDIFDISEVQDILELIIPRLV